MHTTCPFQTLTPTPTPTPTTSKRSPSHLLPLRSFPSLSLTLPNPSPPAPVTRCLAQMGQSVDVEMDGLVQAAHSVADVAGGVLRKYFRQRFDIIDKADLSPVTVADREAEESMVSLISQKFPSHAIYGEENGWRCKEESADYVWVLDPIDGTKSFITDILQARIYLVEMLKKLLLVSEISHMTSLRWYQ